MNASESTSAAEPLSARAKSDAGNFSTQPAGGFGARRSRPALVAALIAVIAATGACMSQNVNKSHAVPVVPRVELARYMGPWFVVGAIGLGLEKGAHNAVETYTMNPDGTIATVFQYRQDSFTGELKTKVTRAWVKERTDNAEWKVRTFWPLKQQYLISHLETDYSAVIVARDARDYVWILARNPKMTDGQYESYLGKIEAMGYDMSKFERYPHNGLMPDLDVRQARPVASAN